jgi:hypothetical protein
MNTQSKQHTRGSLAPYADSYAEVLFGQAKAYSEAWQMACRFKAPHALRKELRWHMRWSAQKMIEQLRRCARRDSTLAWLLPVSRPQNDTGFHEQTGHGKPVAGTAGLSAA